MAGVNKAILIGNLGKDPELKYLPSGQAVANFPLATTERRTDKNGQRQERTEWHNIVVYGKTAEVVNQYLKKGRSAYIEGRITTRSWDDKDGNKRYKTEIIANTVQFLGGPGGAGQQEPSATPDVVADSSGDGDAAPAAGPAGASDDLPF
ncbi:MAG TPA: single-stranded DNA-binding protein [Chitinivibrionales bacterium]|nr:single-stranded DNA-binding protein [Chitinivibrionales bacterium]